MKNKNTGWTYSIKTIDEVADGQNVKVNIYSPDFKLMKEGALGTLIWETIYIPYSHPQADLKKFINSAVKLKIQLYLDKENRIELLNVLAQTQNIPVR